MNDRFTPDKDRLVHKADEDDDRTVRRFGEDDLNAPRHEQNVTPEFQEPRHGDTTPRTDTGARDPLAADRDDVLVVEPADDRHTADDDPVDRHRVPGDLDDGSRDSPFAHVKDPAVTPATPVTGTDAHPVTGTDSPVTSGFPESGTDRPDDVLEESAGFTDAGQTAPAPPATAPTTAESLFDQDSEDVRRRWQEVQAGFVDDPRDAVERADSLLDEVTSSFRNALEARATELQGRWKNTEKNDTEDLRTALRDYRATLEQLLDISAGTR